MKCRSILSVSLMSLLAGPAAAGAMGPIMPVNNWTWVGTISAGPVWANAGETQTFFVNDGVEKTYAAEKSSHVLTTGALFLGMQRTLNIQWQGEIGVEVAIAGNAKMQGYIWDDADPEFSNYTYQYKVNHGRIAAKGKLIYTNEDYWLTPWLSASLGVGFNHAFDFINTPLDFTAIMNENYTSNTQTSFSYTLGAGIQKQVSDHVQVGVGYEFADWGKSQLGRFASQTLNSGLSMDHLYTNGFLFNLTYVA